MTTREQFIQAVESTQAPEHQWTRDRWGHFRLAHPGRPMRLKIGKLAVRLEVQGTYQDGGKFWTNRTSEYYSKLLTMNGQIILGGFKFGKSLDDIGI